MKTYPIVITVTKTYKCRIEAESQTQALLIATQEYQNNGTELMEEDWSTNTRIFCEGEQQRASFIELEDVRK